MWSIDEIKAYSTRIAEEFNPERIILFGSFARKRATEDSDVDLLVIMDYDGRGVEQSYRMRQIVSPAFPLDLVVRRPEEVSERVKEGDYFLSEILREGIVLYERTSQRVDAEG
jgi:predicted nucleotidyltransferase